MAITGMSPGNPYPIGPVAKGRQDEFGAYTAGTWNPDDPDMGGILETAYTGQVCCAVTTPVAKEGGYLGLPIIHFNS